MTIHRLHPDWSRFLQFAIDPDDVEAKLGEDCLFHIDRSPRPYAALWRPLRICFGAAPGSKATQRPDLAVTSGRLYLSERASGVLRALVDGCGELLEVADESGSGYLLNILRLAEQVDGVDTRLSRKNAYGDLEHLVFHEDRVAAMPVFRTAFDDYFGIYCGDAFKDAVEQAGLTGLRFGVDLGNPFPPDDGAQAPTRH